ncbi:MAG TPA: uracil-DNA glycosylase [Candidatus Aminicenantes bacterium]|nr:uracil-DNA glycosylase [Candidatus Aminicenantes bacterium]
MNRTGLAEWLHFFRELGVDSLNLPAIALVGKESVSLESLHQRIHSCTRCSLHQTRRQSVPGEGAPKPLILFVGEGPGEQEDREGRPFVGKAGQLLDRLIQRMGHSRESVFIGNIVKCRPPGNRDPNDSEVEACLPYLYQQIDLLSPRVIVCLGKVAANRLLGNHAAISRMRGRIFSFKGIPVVPTFHPSYILHQRGKESISKAKWEVWADMQEVLKLLKP